MQKAVSMANDPLYIFMLRHRFNTIYCLLAFEVVVILTLVYLYGGALGLLPSFPCRLLLYLVVRCTFVFRRHLGSVKIKTTRV